MEKEKLESMLPPKESEEQPTSNEGEEQPTSSNCNEEQAVEVAKQMAVVHYHNVSYLYCLSFVILLV